MGRIIALALLSLTLSSLSAAAPVSDTIGRIQTDVREGSITEIALEAVSSPYTEEWLDAWTFDKIAFGEAYSPILSELLPFDNPVASEEKNGAVTIMDLADGTVLSFIFRNGCIWALSTAP